MAADERLEPLAALEQRQAAQVLLSIAQQIEDDERDRLIALEAGDVARAEQMDAPLQLLESCRLAVLVERNELAVDHQWNAGRGAELFKCADHSWELRRLVVAETRPQSNEMFVFARLDLGDRSDAVVLRFIHERRVDEWRLGQRGEHRFERVGCRPPARQRGWCANGLFRR